MADPFVAEIRIFGFTFAPTGWAFCDGSLLPISQNTALFALLGTTYGGDGKSTFALPDLRDAVPMHHGQAPGLQPHSLGDSGGSATTTLLESEMPAHAHTLRASNALGDTPNPAGHTLARYADAYAPPGTPAIPAVQAAAVAGGSAPHNNMQPSLALNFCIALQGVFPQRP